MAVRARYAPSPSGALHLGNARTALLAWLDARSIGGTFILRMEDLDPQRSSRAAADGIIEDLRWLGMDWDEGPDVGGPSGPYEQSARRDRYRDAIARLLRERRAFDCSCSRAEVARASQAPHAGEEGPRYPGTCRCGAANPERPRSVRLRVDEGRVAFDDLVHGPQSFDVAAETGDFVIQRADGVAAYQLAVALDDVSMGITRVVRGDDLLASTPRQILVDRALGLTPPSYGHLPLLLGEDGHRLAKRGGALTLQALRVRGARPEKIVGLLARSAGLAVDGAVHAHELVRAFRLDQIAIEPRTITENDLANLG